MLTLGVSESAYGPFLDYPDPHQKNQRRKVYNDRTTRERMFYAEHIPIDYYTNRCLISYFRSRFQVFRVLLA
jgi:hypothetical protein